MMVYQTCGTCSRAIFFEVEEDVLTFCKFKGGCPGNTQGVARLVTGSKIGKVIDLLKGIRCQNGTSCPDQLAQALEAYRAGDRSRLREVEEGRP